MTEKADWTVLVYIAAHNNLDAWGRRSLNQILDVGSTPRVRLAALYDHAAGATRYLAGGPGKAASEQQLGEFDSGDPVSLLNAACWTFRHCPAERYALVLWSHGSGWEPQEIARVAREARGDDDVSASEGVERSGQPGAMALFRTTLAEVLQQGYDERAICFDDGSCRALDTLQLEWVLQRIAANIGQPLDLLGLDACAMATAEVAYQVREHARCLVASEELVPVQSWPYDAILGALQDDPEIPTRDLAATVVRQYVDYYAKHPPVLNGGDVTKVALDLAHIEEAVQPLDALAGALLNDLGTQADCLWHAQKKTRERETKTEWGTRRMTKFRFFLWDLGTMAAHLAAHSENAAVQDAARAVVTALRPNGAVIAEGHHGEWFEGIGGVSIYLPSPNVADRVSPCYADLALAREARWGEMLRGYHARLL